MAQQTVFNMVLMLTVMTTVGCTSAIDELFLTNPLNETQTIAESELFSKDRILFFTCGCNPCVEAASKVAMISQKIDCISHLPASALLTFAGKANWEGRIWMDQGGLFMNKHHFMDCPAFAKIVDGKLRAINIDELIGAKK